MHGKGHGKILLSVCALAGACCFGSANGYGQQISKLAASISPSSETSPDLRALTDTLSGLIGDLQTQVQTLNSQLSDLRAEQQRASEEARELRRELDLMKAQAPLVSPEPATDAMSITAASLPSDSAGLLVSPRSEALPQEPSASERIAKLEENQDVLEGKINDQYQTKVESGSKYRLRLSGMVLLNLYDNRGPVDNQDFPQYVEAPDEEQFFTSPSAFGGSLRQSQLKLQAFGPDILGARTSADVEVDFAGGFADQWNGAAMGLVRLRTGTMRLDWTNTSIVAGQDSLFFVPLAPTSLATMAIPALSYAGNLWSWTPQVRVEHRIPLSENSKIQLQAGILDSLTGDPPEPGDNTRLPAWGEESGQPAYAARIAWSHRAFGQDLTVGAGGYYGRQDWGLNRNVDGWAGTLDLSVPLGKMFEFTGAFYRGRAVAGLGGGVGQSVVLNGSFVNSSTRFRGLDSIGGWAQLKFKPSARLQFNGALGVDNPFANELRTYQVNSIYDDSYTRNLSPLVNVIYQLRSDVLISMEYRWLKTGILDEGSNSATHVNLTVGYIF